MKIVRRIKQFPSIFVVGIILGLLLMLLSPVRSIVSGVVGATGNLVSGPVDSA